MNVRTNIHLREILFFAASAAAIFAAPGAAGAQERYADAEISPRGWIMREMKTFSGTVPSRAWIFGQKNAEIDEKRDFIGENAKNADGSQNKEDADIDRLNKIQNDRDGEVFASILVTEGVVGGLRPQKQSAILKLYVESMIRAWGGTTGDDGIAGDEIYLPPDADPSDAPPLPPSDAEAFCGRNASYRVGASFGASKYVYYGCGIFRPDLYRIVFLVTWLPDPGDDKSAAGRFAPFLDGISLGEE